MLRLEVLDYAGPRRWRWRLTSPTGAFLADHEVSLDSSTWQHEAFLDLPEYLRSYAAPDRRESREAELLRQVGDWLVSNVLGPVATRLARHRGPVRLDLPLEAAVLGYLPWELACPRVTFVVDHQPLLPVEKRPVGARLRMLAIFSLPEGAGALNLRKERFALARLVHRIAAVNNKAIELRVLQYGATRERLSDALLEADGWDVVHLSGHGLPAGVVLETSAGERDRISSVELVDLLEDAAPQIKLVTLCACSSAAVTAEEQLSLLGFSLPTRAESADSGSLPAVATEVVRRLDCAVVAMRYPVVDSFAIALSGEFYDLVLGKGHSVVQALSLARARVEPVTALSPVTPTVFGVRSADLVLSPPAGEPVVFQPELAKLAEFPPQPDRFVGRVGPMTRATTALAPHSGKSGVLFHGMAGGGKTACAVELAYTHQDSFPLLAWYAALGSVSTALTEFALALERQLPGLKLVHLVNDIEAFRRFLPALTELLEQHRVLIVLDNAETLLTDDGQWRDERWSLLVRAMTAHKGLSRLVITSRIRPELPVVVEAVHALSLRETALLAREWPHLATLMDEDPILAAEVLTTVQGHPKLIELANGLATDRVALGARLEGARKAWMERGTRLEPFLRGDDPAASDTDYLSVLADWTRATVRALPEQAREMFLELCCTEGNDRRTFFNQDRGDELALLAERGLIEFADRQHHLRIHPGVAEAGRAMADRGFAREVDEKFANMWVASLAFGRDREPSDGNSTFLVDAAVGAAPYLHRLNRWEQLAWACDAALRREHTPGMVALLLPFIEAVVAHDNGLPALNLHARTVASIDRPRGQAMLRDLLTRAAAEKSYAVASASATNLAQTYRADGKLIEALEFARKASEYTRLAGLGPWSQLSTEHGELSILLDLGREREALEGVRRLLARLPDSSDEPEKIPTWHVLELLLNLGSNAAAAVGDHLAATAYAEDLVQRLASRGASPIEQVVSRSSLANRLAEAGKVAEAREMLVLCRDVCEQYGDIRLLGQVLRDLSSIESRLGHAERAVALTEDSVRYAYVTADPATIGMGHHNLAVLYGNVDSGALRVWAHYMASALIAWRIEHYTLAEEIEMLAMFCFAYSMPAQPTFDEVCALVEETEGVRFRELCERLPPRADNEVQLLTDKAVERATVVFEDWRPLMMAVVMTAVGQPHEQLQAALADLEQSADTVPLVRALRRVVAGERGPELLEGLGMLPYGIVSKVLEAISALERGGS